MTSLEYYIEQIEQFISALTDDIGFGEGTIVTQTKLAVYREVLEHLEEIEQEPSYNSINPELKGDMISRQAVLKQIDQWAIGSREYLYTNATYYLTRRIQDIPPVNPTKTGHWIKVTNGRGGHECDLCHEYAPSYQSGDEYLSKYCPSCGERMIEPQERSEKE